MWKADDAAFSFQDRRVFTVDLSLYGSALDVSIYVYVLLLEYVCANAVHVGRVKS